MLQTLVDVTLTYLEMNSLANVTTRMLAVVIRNNTFYYDFKILKLNNK